MRKTRPGIEKYYDSVIYAPSYVKLQKFLHNSNFLYYKTPLKTKRLEWFTKVFHNTPLPFSPKEIFKINDFDIYPIAQSHLDAAWLWVVNDTKVRAYKTFYAALKHLKEYPYFSISMTSPQYFNWIKRYDPKMWEEVKEQVSKNKIDLTGGMWIEPALRMCSGEALVRQRLYGQLFYLRNFGKISKISSLLDVFGFPYTLPQILVKSGADSFWTTKITWNDRSDYPFSNFIWRGLDGSEIFTHMFKFQINAMMDFGLYKKMGRRPNAKDLVFNSHDSLKEMNSVLSDEHVRTLGWFYGKGDGGKGPIFTEIQYMENFAKYYGFKHTTTHRYFEILKKDVGDRIVTWDDELYLEYHRGCLTTQARVKKGNRNSEELTIACEVLNTLMLLAPGFNGHKYPKEILEDCWQKTLFNQFHDILPGSSIPEVYLLTWKEHDHVINAMRSLLKKSLLHIYAGLPPEKGDIILYNPVSVKNTAIVNDNSNEYLIKDIEPFSVLVLNKEDIRKWYEKNKHEITTSTDPSTIKIENDYITATFSNVNGNMIGFNLKSQNSIDNFLYGSRNQVEEHTEKIVMKDNTVKKHKMRFKGARISVFREPMGKGQMYPAWNIDKNYTSYPVKVTLVDGPKLEFIGNNITVTSTYNVKKSQIVVKYIFRPLSDSIDVKFYIKLQDNKLLFKYFIPLNLYSEQVRCEIPYGSIIRSRNPKSEMEEGKWEYSMQKWMDISDTDVGFSVLNDSKYGLSANMKGVSITLVRSPHYPTDPYHTREIKFPPGKRPSNTDLGTHEIPLRLVPHKGSWMEQEIPHKGLVYNNPVICIETNDHNHNSQVETVFNEKLSVKPYNKEGLQGLEVILPRISSDHSNVIVSTFKPSEWVSNDTNNYRVEQKHEHEDYSLPENPDEWIWDEKTLVIRAYECGGSKVSTAIRFHNIPEKIELTAEEMDLLEYKIGKKLEVVRNMANNTVVIYAEFAPHEIKSIRLTIK